MCITSKIKVWSELERRRAEINPLSEYAQPIALRWE